MGHRGGRSGTDRARGPGATGEDGPGLAVSRGAETRSGRRERSLTTLEINAQEIGSPSDVRWRPGMGGRCPDRHCLVPMRPGLGFQSTRPDPSRGAVDPAPPRRRGLPDRSRRPALVAMAACGSSKNERGRDHRADGVTVSGHAPDGRPGSVPGPGEGLRARSICAKVQTRPSSPGGGRATRGG